MAMRADAEGFLLGSPIASLQRAGENHLSSIDRNITNLTKAVLAGAKLPYSSRAVATVTAKLRGEAAASSSASRLPAPGGMIAVPGGMRDASGRFIKNGSSAALRGAAGAAASDPSVQAFQEVAQPIIRGLVGLKRTGNVQPPGVQRQEKWFKRILKRLQGIEEAQGKPVTLEERGGGVFGMLARAVPALTPVISGLAAAIAIQLPNADFIAHAFAGSVADEVPWVAGFPGDVATAAHSVWFGSSALPMPRFIRDTHNNYVCISTFKRAEDGKHRRRKDCWAGLWLVLLDDLGTKVSLDALRLAPSCLVETSPGNYQAWLALAQAERNQTKAQALIDGLIKAGASDPGAGNLTRYGRLPTGINGKAKYAKDGTCWGRNPSV